VYNTLHQFTDVGLLRQVAVDGSKTYFDTNVSISAVTWRSPLLNRIQPTAIRWRVGRRPTSRGMDFTSRHGHRGARGRARDPLGAPLPRPPASAGRIQRKALSGPAPPPERKPEK